MELNESNQTADIHELAHGFCVSKHIGFILYIGFMNGSILFI